MNGELKVLKDQIERGGVVAFTGSGISEESGISTYRGEGGFWRKYDPSKYASVDYFEKDPSYYWSFFRDTRGPLLHEAKPNPAHETLAELEKRGKVTAVITQNIDGLHQAAGSKKVIELHGSSHRFYCRECRKTYSLSEAEEALERELPPLCLDCKGVLRPDVVFFGEMLPPHALEEAFDLAAKSPLLLVVGSSLVVYPAAQVPLVAKSAGAHLAIINQEPTALDYIADWTIAGKAGQILPLLLG